jgi:general secretion pathway protein D
LSTGGDEPIRVDVRFIFVGDAFLERIGVDFDFDVLMPGAEQSSEDTTGNGAGSPLGFAILSDIEAFFFVQAAGGDAQHNMFSGPNVTLIDGQAGDDNGQTDPLTEPGGVNSGAGDFDSDSGDSNSGDSDSGDSSSDASRSPVLGELPIVGRMFRRIPRAQVDVDAPTLDAISRDTAVTVPDGGTIVLGGLRSRQRDRQDREGPVLSKLPYVNRLFRNIATGRETSNLMLMVTPRIIIQEEDEE